MYNFDGKHRHRPSISLGGASKKEQRDSLLQRNVQERNRREEVRQRLASAIKIQAVYRGWVTRRRQGALLRQSFDSSMPSAMQDNPNLDQVFELLRKLFYFFKPMEDFQRLTMLCQVLLKLHKNKQLLDDKNAAQGIFAMKSLLLLCCRSLELAKYPEISLAMPLRILEVFTDYKSYTTLTEEYAKNYVRVMSSYVVQNGYFKYIRFLLELKVPASLEMSPKPLTPLAATTRNLILHPINLVHTAMDETSSTTQQRHAVMHRFADEILSIEMPVQISHFLVPAIASDIPFASLVETLLRKEQATETQWTNNKNFARGKTAFVGQCSGASQWLLYSVLTFAEKQLGTLTTSNLANYAVLLRNLLPFLQKPNGRRLSNKGMEESDSDSDSDESTEHMEYSDNTYTVIRNKCCNVFDSRAHVDLLLSHIDDVNLAKPEGMSYLDSLYHMAQLLLKEQKAQPHRTRFLYRLAFRNAFLRNLWLLLRSEKALNAVGKEMTLLQLLSRGSSLTEMEQDKIVPALNVFSVLFRHALFCIYDTDFYSEDAGNGKSAMPFSIKEMIEMCDVLKDIVIGLIELMYSETRPLIIQSYGKAIKSINARRSFGISQATFYNTLCLNVTNLIMHLHSRDCRHNFCPPDSWLSQRIVINAEQVEINAFLERRNTDIDKDNAFGMSALTARNLALLQLMPFTIPFLQRVVVFQRIIVEDRRLSQGDNPYMNQSSFLNLSVNRKYLYQDAYDQLSQDRESDIKRIIRVQMINAQGLDEAGIDGGGIFREFMDQLLKTAFDPSYGFFKVTSEQLLYPNPQANRVVPNFLKHFHFLGRMLGKAIYENMMIELPLAPFFLCKLLNRQSSDVDIHHLESLDPELYRNLLYLKNFDGNLDELALNFTVMSDDYGEVQVHELKPGGRDIPVVNSNKIEYIHLMADYKLNKQIRGHCNAFRAGLADVVNIEWLQMFDHREFQILISGAPVPVDLKDLRANMSYSGGYDDDTPYIESLWEILDAFTDTQKRQFLKFVTSCSRPPLLGFGDLHPKICIHYGGKEDRLPSASTCMNMLKLPEYKDTATLRDRLLYAVESGAGFELS